MDMKDVFKKRIVVSVLAVVAVAFVAALYLLTFPSGEKVTEKTPPGENVICLGDSLTSGVGASPGMDYPTQLSWLISVTVINAGVPGDTTEGALKRLDRDVLSKSPRIVLVVLGLNDLAGGVPVEEIFSNLEKIVKRIQARGAMVVVGGIDVPRFGKGLRGSYKRLCEETGALLIPDIYEGIIGHEDLMSDELHPNDKGYQIMAERFYGVIRGYLQP
ncbi:MAG TPA: arylesterase [Deltaproteobacteria bacterium]|jgi:lysophospholipase L1-like esterase|nr:arylesterase [Deltaproteobacteria bacterium]HQI02107.1 arylesterase [Deltaproteobacteria bacterium]HQJ08421.1 arylesterase [Deltaproteobacteria bacterium]